jgi:hypothetical protein
LRDLLNELSGFEINGALKGDYDYTLVSVTTDINTPPFPNTAEVSTFVCGKLVPKTHFLSDRIIMEGIAKKSNDWTYLIVACRPHEGAANEYKVRFRPYFSAYNWWGPWGKNAPDNTVYKINYGWMHVEPGSGGGWWEDYFDPGEVAIYKFQTPEPWEPSDTDE